MPLRRVEFLDGVLLDGGHPAPVRWTFTSPDPDHRLAVVFGLSFSATSK